MADRRYTDNPENTENQSIDSAYDELLGKMKSRRVNIDDEYIELFDDEYEDVFSDSSNDVYIGRKKQNDEAADIYFTKPKRRYEDIYSQSDIPVTSDRLPKENRQGRGEPPAPPRQPQRRTTEQPVRKAPPRDGDEISDFEARTGKSVEGRKKHHGKGVVVLAVLLAIVIGFGGILFVTANSIVGEFTKADEIEHIEDVDSLVSESHVKNVLLIGTDKEKGGSARSDSIMIASVNKQTGKITVVSILRDTHLDIPGECEAKVNSAYAWGGANLLVKTIEENFGIKIDDYATVNFEMFTELVDGLGGIEVEVTENEADYINNRHNYKGEEKPEYVESGESVHLTGYQALWYSRIRKLDSDFNRTERQRKVISAIVKDVKGKMNPVGVFELISTAKSVAPFIETTLSTTDFWGLVTSLLICFTKSGADMDKLLVSAQLPFEDSWWFSSEWDGSSISIDLDENREKLYELLYEAPAEDSTTEEASEEF